MGQLKMGEHQAKCRALAVGGVGYKYQVCLNVQKLYVGLDGLDGIVWMDGWKSL